MDVWSQNQKGNGLELLNHNEQQQQEDHPESARLEPLAQTHSLATDAR